MDKRWREHYQDGVPYEINADQYSSLVALFDEACQKYSGNVAYSNFGVDITYKELDTLSGHFTAYLQSLGLEKGARIAIMLPNILQYPVVLFGALRGGYTVVNTNPLYTSEEVGHQVNDAGAEVIVVMANFAETVQKALPLMPAIKKVVITQMGDLFPFAKRCMMNFILKYVKRMVPSHTIAQAIELRNALNIGRQRAPQWVMVDHEDIAFLQYTGGTTGVSKGAILTHGNLVANVLQASAWISPLKLDSQDTIITALPLYHIFSLTANCLTFLSVGAKNILITNPRNAGHFIDEIKNTRFTAFTGVNTMFNSLLSHPKFKEIDFSQLKMALSGGMALQKSVSMRWTEMTGKRILEAYGLTETSPAATINPMYIKKYNGSIGLPLPSTDVSIRDENEQEVAVGQSGEVCIKGPQVMRGYWQKPEETALVFTRDGYLKTGDIGKMDEEGYIYLVDRKKDMILVSGFNVYPNEIEQVLGLHPGILEVGVVGIPDEESGERVKACVVKKDPNLSAEEIIAYCRQHLTAYKIPKIVEFYDDLPKTNVGKILRRSLKKTFDVEEAEAV